MHLLFYNPHPQSMIFVLLFSIQVGMYVDSGIAGSAFLSTIDDRFCELHIT